MKQSSPAPKKRLAPETFNMLCAVAFLVAAVMLATGVHALLKYKRERTAEADRLKITAETPVDRGIACWLENPVRGPLALCSPNCPRSEAQVDATAGALISLCSFSDGAEPYLTASPTLQAQPEAVMALRDMCSALALTGVAATPVITEAYRTYDAAGTMAGKTDLHTGYALTYTLRVTNGGTAQDISPANADTNPVSASAARWILSNRARFGFIAPQSENPAHLLYVGAAHAAAIEQNACTPEAYLAMLRTHPQSSPLQVTNGTRTWRIFYVPADHGVASVTLPSTLPYTVSGDGSSGFVVTLLDA